MANAVDRFVHGFPAVCPQPDHPAPEPPECGYFSMHRDNAVEDHMRAAFQLLARMHERFPPLSRLVSATAGRQRPPDQQTLDRSATRHAPSEQPGGKDAGIVDDEQITRGETTPELCKHRVLDAVAAAKDEQTRPTTIGRRMLRDQRVRQLEVEISNVHFAVTQPTFLSRPSRPSSPSCRFRRGHRLAVQPGCVRRHHYRGRPGRSQRRAGTASSAA